MEDVEWAKGIIEAPLTVQTANHLVEIVRDRMDSRAEMAAWALGFGELPDEARGGVLDALLDVVTDETHSERLRGQAAEAIAECLEYSADAEARDRASDLLIDLLRDASPTVRFWAAFALGKLRAASALPALRELKADSALAPGWWTVGDEAADAIEAIEGRPPPARALGAVRTNRRPRPE